MATAWYDSSDNTVVVGFNKFLPSYPTEGSFAIPDGEYSNEELDYYYIEWNVVDEISIPTLIKKSEVEIQAIVDARAQAVSDQLTEDAALETLGYLVIAEKETDGLKYNTPDEVKQKIDDMFAGASTNTETVDVIKLILKKLAVRSLI